VVDHIIISIDYPHNKNLLEKFLSNNIKMDFGGKTTINLVIKPNTTSVWQNSLAGILNCHENRSLLIKFSIGSRQMRP
jgi:hypothetical protein